MKFKPEIDLKGIVPQVKTLDFQRLSWKLCQSAEADMTVAECALAEQEYRRFLTLKVRYPKTSFVPNKLVDRFWHAHILDTEAYQKDCQTLFGGYLHHFPYFGIYGEEDAQNLKDTFKETKKIYAQHFGQYPDNLETASRCEDHACHVEASCACRVEGACQDIGIQKSA